MTGVDGHDVEQAGSRGRAGALTALLFGWGSLPVYFIGSTSFVVGLMLAGASLGLAAYCIAEHRSAWTTAVAIMGAVGASLGPVLWVAGFVLVQ